MRRLRHQTVPKKSRASLLASHVLQTGSTVLRLPTVLPPLITPHASHFTLLPAVLSPFDHRHRLGFRGDTSREHQADPSSCLANGSLDHGFHGNYIRGDLRSELDAVGTCAKEPPGQRSNLPYRPPWWTYQTIESTTHSCSLPSTPTESYASPDSWRWYSWSLGR